ncbi:MAG TPA: copper chaperone CopZ [Clostridiales bacterium]|nr:copper chaperone CopZ [Clostridiales bacterium]
MALQTVKLNVEGMSCNHCVNAITKAVGSLDGVKRVEVSLELKTVTAEFDPAKVTEQQIVETILDQGYDVV